MKISIVIVTFNNSVQFKRLIKQIVNITDFYDYEKNLIIIDNTEEQTERNKISEIVKEYMSQIDIDFVTTEHNRMLAHATNIAIDRCDSDYFVYLCSSHTYIYHKDWLKLMVDNMESVKGAPYAMGGCIAHWPNSFKDKKLHIHVQGGVFIAPTKIMKEYKYNEIKYRHSFMDVDICERLLLAGFKLKKIQGIYSGLTGWGRKYHVDNLEKKRIYLAHSREVTDYA